MLMCLIARGIDMVLETSTFPCNKEIFQKHNFLCNVPTSQRNKAYEKVSEQGDYSFASNCNVHPSQKDFNVLKVILKQWNMRGKPNPVVFDLNSCTKDLRLQNYTYDEKNNRKSSNLTNNFKAIEKRVSNLASFTIEASRNGTSSKFRFIEEVIKQKGVNDKIEITLCPAFIESFLKERLQSVPLIVLTGEYEQKVLDFLLTEVQTTQNLKGEHKDRKFRFKSFTMTHLLKFFKVTDINPRKITRALASVGEQVNGMDIGVKIPKFRLKKGKYEVSDYCYE
jgi:hypothetical protein